MPTGIDFPWFWARFYWLGKNVVDVFSCFSCIVYVSCWCVLKLSCFITQKLKYMQFIRFKNKYKFCFMLHYCSHYDSIFYIKQPNFYWKCSVFPQKQKQKRKQKKLALENILASANKYHMTRSEVSSETWLFLVLLLSLCNKEIKRARVICWRK